MAKLIHDKIFGMPKHGRTMPEPFTGDKHIDIEKHGIEKHGITKYKQTPEPYFDPYEITGGGTRDDMKDRINSVQKHMIYCIGGGNQWGWPDEWPVF